MRLLRWIRRVILGQYLEPTEHERWLSVISRTRIDYVSREERSV